MSHDHALALIREGWALHARGGGPAAPDDPDLALLLGDRLYAAGLLELVALEDIGAVRAMAHVISSCARSLAEGEPSRAATAWEAGERQVREGAANRRGPIDHTPATK